MSGSSTQKVAAHTFCTQWSAAKLDLPSDLGNGHAVTTSTSMQEMSTSPTSPCSNHSAQNTQNQLHWLRPNPGNKDRIAILTTTDSYLCPTTPEGNLSNIEWNSTHHLCLCADNPRKSRGHAWNSHQTLQRHWHYILCKNTCSLEPGVRHSLMQEFKTLLWFGSSQVVLSVAGESAQQFVGATALPSVSRRPPRSWGVQYAQVCSKHLFRQSVIEVKTLGIIRWLHVSKCFIWIDHSAYFFLGKCLLQELPQVLVSEAILRTGSRERARPLFALWLHLLRAVRKRRFNSAAADASWFDLARGLQLRANCTAKGSIVSRGLVNPILSKVNI